MESIRHRRPGHWGLRIRRFLHAQYGDLGAAPGPGESPPDGACLRRKWRSANAERHDGARSRIDFLNGPRQDGTLCPYAVYSKGHEDFAHTDGAKPGPSWASY